MENIQDLIDDAKCYQTIRDLRWPAGVTCPHCSLGSVIKKNAMTPSPTANATKASSQKLHAIQVRWLCSQGQRIPLSACLQGFSLIWSHRSMSNGLFQSQPCHENNRNAAGPRS